MALTPEQKEKMAAGRQAAREQRARDAVLAQAAKLAVPEIEPVVMPPVPRESDVPEAVLEDESGVTEPPVAGMPDPFEAFLAAQDEDTRSLLTDAELRIVYEVETKRAEEAKKTAAKKSAAARAQRHAQAVAGLIPAEQMTEFARQERLNRKVTWTVNMPETGGATPNGRPVLIDEGMRIDGRLLVHGTKITGTMAEYESYRSIEWLAHQNELDFQGKGRLSRLRQTATGFINGRVPL